MSSSRYLCRILSGGRDLRRRIPLMKVFDKNYIVVSF